MYVTHNVKHQSKMSCIMYIVQCTHVYYTQRQMHKYNVYVTHTKCTLQLRVMSSVKQQT